ncbi:MAG: hypothetical protein QGG40_21710, partial [Myxococcota bacterium]|nr:hypothetical protein [Myxococcota bacterium]
KSTARAAVKKKAALERAQKKSAETGQGSDEDNCADAPELYRDDCYALTGALRAAKQAMDQAAAPGATWEDIEKAINATSTSLGGFMERDTVMVGMIRESSTATQSVDTTRTGNGVCHAVCDCRKGSPAGRRGDRIRVPVDMSYGMPSYSRGHDACSNQPDEGCDFVQGRDGRGTNAGASWFFLDFEGQCQ